MAESGSVEHAAFGQRHEVVPVMHREGLKGTIRALGEDVIGCVLYHTSPLYALELPAQFAVHLKQPGLVLRLGLLGDDALFLSWRLFPELAAEPPASSRLGYLLLLVVFQLGLIPSNEVDFISCIESHDIKFFGGIFGNSDDILSDILTAGAKGRHGRWTSKARDWEDPWRPFQHHNAWQHATIIAFFLLSALVDLTSQVWLEQLSMKLEWAVTALALVIVLEMVALPEHRNTLEFQVHTLLMLPAFLLALVLTIKENAFRKTQVPPCLDNPGLLRELDPSNMS
ncbi:hypothetical protein Celaphus_00012562 [Cervus elaphus hippelaphus]|uniref:Uncharacterized protein n=1 Tax=Cervus elaphus hippelaphus TaxID=46360 RepID=A0A212CJL1_CEREH|nr:hypothetical protein Celaphus_00012562 [Cervus elaphus hippelaphus]